MSSTSLCCQFSSIFATLAALSVTKLRTEQANYFLRVWMVSSATWTRYSATFTSSGRLELSCYFAISGQARSSEGQSVLADLELLCKSLCQVLRTPVANGDGNIIPCMKCDVTDIGFCSISMLYFERSLMVFLLLQNCVENYQEISSKLHTRLLVILMLTLTLVGPYLSTVKTILCWNWKV